MAQAFGAVAEAAGPGRAGACARARLGELAARASAEERDLLQRIIFGEMRMGLSDGLVLEAIARGGRRSGRGGAPGRARHRRPHRGGHARAHRRRRGPAAATPRVFVPLLPMLAEVAADPAEALDAHGGASAMEYKYDGARIQLHRDGDRVAIWSRRMTDVTRSLPDIVAIARRDLSGARSSWTARSSPSTRRVARCRSRS